MFDLEHFMRMDVETIYGEKRYVLYDEKEYDTDEKFNKSMQLADMHINRAIGGEDCNMIVLDEPTYKFWKKLVERYKEKSKTEGFIEGMNFKAGGDDYK